MNIQEFSKYFAQAKVEIKQAINSDIPRIVGNRAASMFRQNFQNEGFFGQRWQEVKRRMDPTTKGADARRKILTGRTGNLGRSLEVTSGNGKAVITSDLPYSAAHNEGTSNAGRGRHTRIPRRQFMGDHPEIDRMVEKEIEKSINKILNR